MTDDQVSACERIDTHPWIPRRVWVPELKRELGVPEHESLLDRFRYATLSPSQKMLSIDTWCRWYKGLL